jgi:hypothetical protein
MDPEKIQEEELASTPGPIKGRETPRPHREEGKHHDHREGKHHDQSREVIDDIHVACSSETVQ